MKGKVYGYMRVSTREQNEERQKIALRDFGVQVNNIYLDKQSGKDFDRPMYQKLLKNIQEGDLIVVKSIDRLGRNYEEILNQWHLITKEKRADIVIIDMPLLDTRQGNDLTGVVITDIVLQLLSYIAENERMMIRQRQREGIEAAKIRGVKFGRPEIPLPPNFIEEYERWKNGEITMQEAAKQCGLKTKTFRNKVKKYETTQKSI